MAGCPWLVAAVVVAAVCGCRSTGKRGQERQVAACALGLEAAMNAPAGDRVAKVADDCSHACPGLEQLARARARAGAAADSDRGDPGTPPAARDVMAEFLAGCDLFCSDRAAAAWRRARPPRRFAALARECGVSRYGLSDADAYVLSADWLALHRIARWLVARRGDADPSTRGALDRAGHGTDFVLPLPARVEGLYRLAWSREALPSGAPLYLIVRGREIRAGAAPAARILPGGLERRAGRFPPPALAAPAADFRALAGELSRPDEGSRAGPTALVLLDRDAPAGDVAAAAVAVVQQRFALGVSGYSARAHSTTLEILTTQGSAAPLLQMGRGQWTVVGDGDELHIPFDPPGEPELVRKLTALSVRRAPQNKIELALPERATVADLVAVLDIVAQTKFAVALLQPPGHAP